MNKITPKFIPKPPKKLIKWLIALGRFSSAFLIFKCGWKADALTGKKSRCLDVVCSKCGKHFKSSRAEELDGDLFIRSGKKRICPHCGADAKCVHVSEMPQGIIECQWPLVLSKKNGAIIVAGYRVMRTIGKDGSTDFKIDPYEAYIFDGPKAYRFAGWDSGGFGIQNFTGEWQQRKQFTDYYGEAYLEYYIQEDIFEGTYFANCKFEIYKHHAKKENLYRPISYLREFQKHPQIENLLVQGFEKIAVRCAVWKAEGINWKESSPRKMLGLSNPDFIALKQKGATLDEIVKFRLIRDNVSKLTQSEMLWALSYFGYNIENLVKEKDADRIIKYFKKQKAPKNKAPSFTDWRDYIRITKELGYDINDKNIRFPKNLGAAHDRMNQALKYKRNQELILKFQVMYQQLLKYCWEKDGLIIRPAASEDELIQEGKVLAHCVGGYGKAHCGGNPIFFIRRAREPDKPYYTLQLDLARKVIIQNRGYKNNQVNNPKPPEIDQFAEAWLNQVVKAVRVKKKKKHVA